MYRNATLLPTCILLTFMVVAHALAAAPPTDPSLRLDGPKTASMTVDTPQPKRFVVRGTSLVDRAAGEPAFFRGIGYSPYLPGETPLFGAPPGDDERYVEHFLRFRELGVNYLHVFPLLMPKGFFEELDKSDLVYGQDIWVMGGAEDFLDPVFQKNTIDQIKAVIDHTYTVGRPDRLVLFSVGDELLPDAIMRTDSRHPEVRDYAGKHVRVSGRTPTEVALARLIDAAIDYELTRYGQRHLYCHTSWTHVGPLADRPDLEVEPDSVLVPDMGDLWCMNIYTYARGVKTSPPGSATRSPYQGYLEELAAFVSKPIIVTQVGLSTSPIEPKAWVPGFGGHRVEDVPRTLSSVWQDLRTAKGRGTFAGLVFFELHDEWWKSGEDAGDPASHEPEDPEEWFGVYAVDQDNKLVPKGQVPATLHRLFTE